MIKLFFITFFIAELIIFASIVLKIHKINKSVNKLNNLVLKNRLNIKVFFTDIRFIIEEFNNNFIKLKELIEQKRQEYLFRFFKTSLIYGSIFFLRGKYKKTILAYQIIREIYEAVQTA